jgi:hypothetical protein
MFIIHYEGKCSFLHKAGYIDHEHMKFYIGGETNG